MQGPQEKGSHSRQRGGKGTDAWHWEDSGQCRKKGLSGKAGQECPWAQPTGSETDPREGEGPREPHPSFSCRKSGRDVVASQIEPQREKTMEKGREEPRT